MVGCGAQQVACRGAQQAFCRGAQQSRWGRQQSRCGRQHLTLAGRQHLLAFWQQLSTAWQQEATGAPHPWPPLNNNPASALLESPATQATANIVPQIFRLIFISF